MIAVAAAAESGLACVDLRGDAAAAAAVVLAAAVTSHPCAHRQLVHVWPAPYDPPLAISPHSSKITRRCSSVEGSTRPKARSIAASEVTSRPAAAAKFTAIGLDCGRAFADTSSRTSRDKSRRLAPVASRLEAVIAPFHCHEQGSSPRASRRLLRAIDRAKPVIRTVIMYETKN